MSPSQLETYPLFAMAYAVVVYTVMVATAFWLIGMKTVAAKATMPSARYGTIDGFRGLLAVGVFVHHSFAAYGYFTLGRWEWSSSPVLNHLGQTTVALFFMITGFLFSLKAMEPSIDWKGFYISRLARLFPLYAVMVCYVFLATLVISEGALREPVWQLGGKFLQWITFVCFGRPDINGIALTWTLIAGVNWSLKFEVLFYIFAFPLLRLLSNKAKPKAALLIIALLLATLLLIRFTSGKGEASSLYWTHFVCGILVAHIYRQTDWQQWLQNSLFKFAAVVSVSVLFFQENAYGVSAILVTTALFAAIVGNFSFWGLLHSRAALWLGDISYGIYLTHGLMLWLALTTLRSLNVLSHLGLLAYTGIILCIGVFIVLISSLSYIKLEKPAMVAARKWSNARLA
jgi:peptidoglycan/LPS O-acetylase OafA/YrhL